MKLQGVFKSIFITNFFGLYITGVIVWVLQKFFSLDHGLGLEAPPSRIWVLRAHCVVGLIFLIAFGYFIKVHIVPGLRQRRKLNGGLSNLAILIFLIGTVPVLLYAVDDRLKNLVANIHTYVGFAFIIPYLIHSLLGPLGRSKV